MMTAYQTQLPDRNSIPAAYWTKVAMSWLATGGNGSGMKSCTQKISRAGISTSQSRPPTRPVLGLRGERSHRASFRTDQRRSEEHTSELQSRQYLVCRLLLEKKSLHTISPS